MKKMICWTLLLGSQRRMYILFVNPRNFIILIKLTILHFRSRLGCQVIASPELDGIRLALPAATRNFAVDGYATKSHWLHTTIKGTCFTCRVWDITICSFHHVNINLASFSWQKWQLGFSNDTVKHIRKSTGYLENFGTKKLQYVDFCCLFME